MNFAIFRLNNGLRVLFLEKEDLKTVFLLLAIKVGSQNEQKNEEGLAHFLEHMLFKGTKNFPESKIIFKELEKIGGYFNGATSYEYTFYYLKALEDYLDDAFFILADLIKNPLLKEDKIEEEKKIIIEEIKKDNDDPLSKALLNFYSLLYPQLPIGRSILGFEESVKKFTREQLISFKNKFYVASNSFLVIIANPQNRKRIFKLVEKYFKDLPRGRESTSPLINISSMKKRVKIERRELNQNYLVMGIHFGPIKKIREVISYELGERILGGISYSRLFISLRENKNLCYYCSSHFHYYSNRSNLIISAGVNKDKLKESLEIIKEEILKIIKEGFKDEEINVVKNTYIADIVNTFEDVFKLAQYSLFYFLVWKKRFTKKIVNKILGKNSLETYINLVRKIKKEEIEKRFGQLLSQNKFALSLLTPKDLRISEKEVFKIIDKI